jgi:hypothetical protein
MSNSHVQTLVCSQQEGNRLKSVLLRLATIPLRPPKLTRYHSNAKFVLLSGESMVAFRVK